MATLALTASAHPVPDCTKSSHDYLREHAWHLLEPLRAARYMPTVDEQGKPCLLEMANCWCHSTLCREVPLMSIADAEREALRVWRVKTGLVDAMPAAFELREMARPLFTGDDE